MNPETSELIALSEGAAKELKRIQEKDPHSEGAALRVRVVGGGCSGMSYKLDFEQTGPGADDHAFDVDGIRVHVDKKSALYLKGMTLDFSGGLNGKGFEFNNPNAKRTCGCGTSFSV